MEKQLNLSLLEGRLTRDPELMKTNNGKPVCKFDLAVNSSFKSGDEYKENVDFFSINAWENLAETCVKYLKKGTKVRVRGKLKQDNWTSSDGRKMSKVKIEASHVEFIGDDTKEKKPQTETIHSKITTPF
ncbi:MAG: hypothetical protein A2015_07980 [Spirochaetes bacterium GWF1_31_7]|nr:MAG: hypothetical protein A2Y30_02070 [Spirochaetes bacterium GWE1_32_154]OHD46978.1 MAG: hypothetical protein A2015_07980 [Spirochaetes bacterium GWF1_31_7]OHD49758.1 MAG: hypothetical protein A2Y29_06180 [Spirochaetes bacterium GWE2_31_10]HBD95512.1 single-stranded DNA-binding protein [Spirochaetia bacterium]HBI36976.1 single-stranded DNA-binding protein [Spirochaetia bacterium]